MIPHVNPLISHLILTQYSANFCRNRRQFLPRHSWLAWNC